MNNRSEPPAGPAAARGSQGGLPDFRQCADAAIDPSSLSWIAPTPGRATAR